MLSRRVLPCVPLLPLLLAVQSPDVLAQASAAAIEFPSSQGQKLHFTSIPNAGKISGQLYRGAQPRPGGLEELKKLGITTIVDLRGEDASLRNREKTGSRVPRFALCGHSGKRMVAADKRASRRVSFSIPRLRPGKSLCALPFRRRPYRRLRCQLPHGPAGLVAKASSA